MNLRYLPLILVLAVGEVSADNSTLDAAIGGAIGGAAGAAIGNELGGRNGAIVGGALGASVGTAVTTDNGSRHGTPQRNQHYGVQPGNPQYQYNNYRRNGDPGYHCPPGQAKKGRC